MVSAQCEKLPHEKGDAFMDSSQRHPSLHERITSVLKQNESDGVLPPNAGLAITVVDDRGAKFSGHYGLRERDHELPITPETIFDISSLTKAFTAAALVLAHEEGRLNLNQPLNARKKLLSLREKEIERQISICDILSHRSGLPGNDLTWYFETLSSSQLLTKLSLFDALPGGFRNSFSYSNALYGALGHLFKDLVGQDWDSYLSEKILSPLAMNSTLLNVSADERNTALPYVGTQRVRRLDVQSVAGAGSIRTNIQDFGKWMSFQLSGKSGAGKSLLSEESLNLIRQRHVSIDFVSPLILQGFEWLAFDLGYGLGWFIGHARGHRIYFHLGLVDGFTTAVAIIPEKNIGVAVFMNLNLCGVAGKIIQEALAHELGWEIESAKSEENNIGLPDALGEYEHPVFGRLNVSDVDGKPALIYQKNIWPLTWKTSDSAEFNIVAFGLSIPMSFQLKIENGTIVSLLVPLSMDPRAGIQEFRKQ
jgi:CubicO group peptidase (beta-lactamase class C family)